MRKYRGMLCESGIGAIVLLCEKFYYETVGWRKGGSTTDHRPRTMDRAWLTVGDGPGEDLETG